MMSPTGGQCHCFVALARRRRSVLQICKLSLVEFGNDVEVAWSSVLRMREHSMSTLASPSDSETLLLWDRGFFSYELWQKMNLTG